MPAGRPSIDLSPFRFEIQQWKIDERLTVKQICDRLNQNFSIIVGRTSLYSQLRAWNTSLQQHTRDSEELRIRIRDLFFDKVLNDHFMLLQLHSEGFIITKTGLSRIRRDLGLWRRQTPEMIAERIQELRRFFENEAELHTKLETYGRTFLYVFVRRNQHILSRRALFSCFRDFSPTCVTERWNTMRYRRAGWTTPGPDFIWSLDAYDKLKAWGIEIYASIDAYSRFITWFYVGISSGTSRSVLAQYLDVLSQRKTMPNIIRSDRGGETILMAGAHYYLSKTRVRVREGTIQDVRFNDCWIYGKSTHNEKIESWWLRLSKGRAKFWRVSKRITFRKYILIKI